MPRSFDGQQSHPPSPHPASWNKPDTWISSYNRGFSTPCLFVTPFSAPSTNPLWMQVTQPSRWRSKRPRTRALNLPSLCWSVLHFVCTRTMLPVYRWLIVMLWLTNAVWCSFCTRSSARSHSASHLLLMVNGCFRSKWCPRTEHLYPYSSQLRAHSYCSIPVHRRRNWENAVSSCSAWLEFLPHY